MEIKDRELLSSKIAGHETGSFDLNEDQLSELNKYGAAIREWFDKPLKEIDFAFDKEGAQKGRTNTMVHKGLYGISAYTDRERESAPQVTTVGELLPYTWEYFARRPGGPNVHVVRRVMTALEKMGLKLGIDPAVVAHVGREIHPQQEDLFTRYETLDDPTVMHDQLLPTGTVFAFGSKKTALLFYEKARNAFENCEGPHLTGDGEIEPSYRNAIKLLPGSTVYLSDAALPVIASADIAKRMERRSVEHSR